MWLLLPLALLFGVRQQASWRPQKIAQLPLWTTTNIVMSPDERFVAKFKATRSYKVFGELPLIVRDLQSGREIEARGKYGWLSTVAFDEHAQILAIGWQESHEGSTQKIGVSVLFLDDRLRDFQIPKGAFSWDYPTQLRFSPDGKTLWMASADNLFSWDIATGKLKWQWRKEGEEVERGNESLPFNSAISEDCRYYFQVDSHFGYSVWDIAKNKRLLVSKLAGHDAFDALSFSPDAAFMVSATRINSQSVIYDSKTARVLWQSPAGTHLTLNNKVAIVQHKNYFEVRDARTGKFLRWLPAEGNVRAIASESVDWLYTVNKRNELFRQRLR